MPRKKNKITNENAKHKEAFYVWYEHDRDVLKACAILNITNPTLYVWIKRYGWNERADELDKKAFAKAEQKIINDKAKRQAEMLKQHYAIGGALISKGLGYIKEKGVDNGNQAISALDKGVKIQRQAEGLPDYILDLFDKSDDELRQELYGLAEDEASEDGSDSESLEG